METGCSLQLYVLFMIVVLLVRSMLSFVLWRWGGGGGGVVVFKQKTAYEI